jgi:hypothetical protein
MKRVLGHAGVADECAPGVLGMRQAPEIARDGTFGDVQAEFQKLTVNSRSAPRLFPGRALKLRCLFVLLSFCLAPKEARIGLF